VAGVRVTTARTRSKRSLRSIGLISAEAAAAMTMPAAARPMFHVPRSPRNADSAPRAAARSAGGTARVTPSVTTSSYSTRPAAPVAAIARPQRVSVWRRRRESAIAAANSASAAASAPTVSQATSDAIRAKSIGTTPAPSRETLSRFARRSPGTRRASGGLIDSSASITSVPTSASVRVTVARSRLKTDRCRS
jgi:hypothetical protein